MGRDYAYFVARSGLDHPRANGLPEAIEPEPPRLAKQLGLALDLPSDQSAA